MRIRIVVVDDTTMFREALRRLIDLEPDMTVVGTAGDGAAGVELIRRERPDVVLMDIRMPGTDGVQATRQIRRELPDTHVVMLTTFSDDSCIFDAIAAGAAGYLLKDMPTEELIRAIRVVSEGGALIPPNIAARLVADYSRLASQHPAPAAPAPAARPTVDLTPRELEILTNLADGLSNKEIATKLFLSEGTVKNYVSLLCLKLGARDRAQAVAIALRQAILQ